MRSDYITNYRRSTDLEADAMINEGGAIKQPSMKDAEAAYARLNTPCSCRPRAWRPFLTHCSHMFLAGFATGLAIALLQNHTDGNT